MPIYKEEGKKDGKQRYRVVVCYTNNLGERKQKVRTAYGSTEAKTLERLLSEELSSGNTASSRMTVEDLYKEYIDAKKNEVRESSLAKTKGILKNHVLNEIGDKSLKKLTTPLLQKWKNSIAEKNLSITMQNNAYKELRAMLNFAVKMEYLPKNPLVVLGSFRDTTHISKPQDAIQYYTEEEFTKYATEAYRAADSLTGWGYYVFFCIAYMTGMRKGEINALKWSDIEGNIIHIRRSVSQKIKGDKVTETPPKNRSSYRDLQMPLPLIEVLKEHKARQQKDPRWSEDYRVCGGIKCLSDTSLSNKNIQFANAAGLHTIRIHDFRHSHASLLVNNGINIQEVARRLGHSNVQITWNTYSHLYPREEERAVSILDKIPVRIL
ncbi:MAG: site-specific integrase [Christensenellaceae bacterium]|nr:site-specific integrase [Christensenellaceae bacterium]